MNFVDNTDNNANNSQQVAPLSNNSQPLIGKCPVVEVQIGETMINCLLDTCSMVTTITESLFKEVFQCWGAPKLKTCGWLALKQLMA